MKRCRYPVVEILWLDSAQLDEGAWITRNRIEQAAADLFQRTVGYLVFDGPDVLVVARSVSDWTDSEEKLEGVLVIPRACIAEQRVAVPARAVA